MKVYDHLGLMKQNKQIRITKSGYDIAVEYKSKQKNTQKLWFIVTMVTTR